MRVEQFIQNSLMASAAALLSTNIASAGSQDFGAKQEHLLGAQSQKLFGFVQPIDSSATSDDVMARELADAEDRQFLAKGLKAQFVTRSVGGNGDMIALWPDDIDYTHLIVCNELGCGGITPGGNGGFNPSLQRVNVATGAVATILHGMARCDGIRTTQWGTVLATEESSADGGAYEIIEPLTTTGHWIADRGGRLSTQHQGRQAYGAGRPVLGGSGGSGQRRGHRWR